MSDRFQKVRFKFHEYIDDKYADIVQIYPELFKHKEFKEYGWSEQRVKIPISEEGEKQTYKNEFKPDKRMATRKQVFAYMSLLFDPLSDLVEEFDNLKERKEAAAIEVGYKRNQNDEWPPEVDELFSFKDPQFIDCCIKFLKLFKSDEWFEICTLQVELDRNNEMRWKGIKGRDVSMTAQEMEKSQKLRDYNQEIMMRLKLLKENFVYGDKVLKEKIEEELITPENAMRIINV